MRLFHDGDETCNLGRTLITAVVLFFHSDRKSIAAHFGVRIVSCAVLSPVFQYIRGGLWWKSITMAELVMFYREKHHNLHYTSRMLLEISSTAV